MCRVLVLTLVMLLSAPALAQHAHHGQHDVQSGYAGMERRAIKALSEQQIADLQAGRGMSLALPAELNGYPGPAHVLELADPLALTPEQRARTQVLFDAMQSEARELGLLLIDAEAGLDRLFAERRATAAAVAAASAQAAAVQGTLRATHLRYHLAMTEVLTTEQVETYNRLRGYRAQ